MAASRQLRFSPRTSILWVASEPCLRRTFTTSGFPWVVANISGVYWRWREREREHYYNDLQKKVTFRLIRLLLEESEILIAKTLFFITYAHYTASMHSGNVYPCCKNGRATCTSTKSRHLSDLPEFTGHHCVDTGTQCA